MNWHRLQFLQCEQLHTHQTVLTVMTKLDTTKDKNARAEITIKVQSCIVQEQSEEVENSNPRTGEESNCLIGV